MKRDELDLLIKNGFLNSKPDKTITDNELGSLVNQGFLEKLPNHFFSFNNNLTWEVIYETLLYSERRLLHNLIALHIEKHNQDKLSNIADLLLYHFDNAQNFKKSVFYGAVAGDKASSMFSIDDAINYYQQSLTSLKKLKGKNLGDLSLLNERIGDVYDTSGQHKLALLAFNESLNIWRQGKSNPKHTPWKIAPSSRDSLICRKIAMTHERMADYDQSLDWLNKAEENLPKRPGKVLAQIYATRSATLYRKGEFNAAIDWGNKSFKASKRNRSNTDIAYAANMLANSLIEIGNFKDATSYLLEALDIQEADEDYKGLANTHYNLGTCQSHLGNLDKAINYFKSVLELDQKMHNLSAIAMDHFKIGNILLIQNKFEPAIQHLHKIIEYYNQGNCRKDLAGTALMLLGKARIVTKDLDKAENHITQSMGLLEELGPNPYLANAKLHLAELKLAQDSPQESLNICGEILDYAQNSDAKLLEIQVVRILGVSLFSLGRIDEALKKLTENIEQAKQIGMRNQEAFNIVEIARIKVKTGDVTEDTYELIKMAVAILEETNAAFDLEEAREVLERVEEFISDDDSV